MKTAILLFPHQLFKENPLLKLEGNIYLIEEYLFFKQYRFHKQKIIFHRASMKFYENYLHQQEFKIQYISSLEDRSDIRILIPFLAKQGIQKLSILDPEDDWLLRRIQRYCNQLQLELEIIESPMFLNSHQELAPFFNPTKKKFFQTEFYKQERIKRNILIEDDHSPTGGQWTYDTENRKKFPKGKVVTKINFPSENEYLVEAKQYTRSNFDDHIGVLETPIHYPISFEESEKWLDDFLTYRFAEFGDYEDAIVRTEMVLNHSLLTPMLNIGLLTPKQIIERVLAHHQKHEIPINSLEGFIRQVIGWREFIRGVYRVKGRQERTRNFWNFHRPIPSSFYDGSTGILPVDETILKVLKTGYCHHIERLMILGNFMLLCEFDPNEVYRWFMELFIDAYDWVMVPNVYGMSQFADGGMMSTKPYISGSNYIMKMSDYPKGEWQEIWDALFWRFMDRQRDFFLSNPRLGMLVKTFDGWDEEKKKMIHQTADWYLNSL